MTFFSLLAETSKIDLQMQRWMFATTVGTFFVVIGKWWTDQRANKKIETKTAEVKEDLRENTEISKTAFSAANALNEKILATQKNIETLQARQTETDGKLSKIFVRLEEKRRRIHQIANDVHTIKVAMNAPDAPPIAGKQAEKQS